MNWLFRWNLVSCASVRLRRGYFCPRLQAAANNVLRGVRRWSGGGFAEVQTVKTRDSGKHCHEISTDTGTGTSRDIWTVLCSAAYPILNGHISCHEHRMRHSLR